MLCGMWDLPGPGLEPASPALAGRLLTTVPPGKSLIVKTMLMSKVTEVSTFPSTLFSEIVSYVCHTAGFVFLHSILVFSQPPKWFKNFFLCYVHTLSCKVQWLLKIA